MLIEKHDNIQSYQKIQLTIKRDMTQTQILVSMMRLRREQVRVRVRARPLARGGDSNAWTTETIESAIQKLKDITDTSWRSKDEYDNRVEALRAKLVEQELLIDQLKEYTATLRQELKGSSIGVHRFYDDFLFHMKDSIESVQAFRDMALCICNNAITTSGGRKDKKENQNGLGKRWHRTQKKKGKGRAPGECQDL